MSGSSTGASDAIRQCLLVKSQAPSLYSIARNPSGAISLPFLQSLYYHPPDGRVEAVPCSLSEAKILPCLACQAHDMHMPPTKRPRSNHCQCPTISARNGQHERAATQEEVGRAGKRMPLTWLWQVLAVPDGEVASDVKYMVYLSRNWRSMTRYWSFVPLSPPSSLSPLFLGFSFSVCLRHERTLGQRGRSASA